MCSKNLGTANFPTVNTSGQPVMQQIAIEEKQVSFKRAFVNIMSTKAFGFTLPGK